MITEQKPKWLSWAQSIQALAQSGLAYAKDPFDIERYNALRKIAAEICAEHTDHDHAFIHELFNGEMGYATPKIDVRGFVLHENKLLMVREREDNCWTIPGGWADVGQSASECVVREIWEESGYCAKAVRLLAVYDRDKHNHPPSPFYLYKIFFQCELIGGVPTTSIETSDIGFFAQDELPELSISRITPEQIARMFELVQNSTHPSDFD
jgi:ADP-ribose pyrophosphatase YjhB (NUDIX family)